MSTPTAAQIDALLNFLEKHRDLTRGNLRSIERRTLSHRLWEDICTTLNAMGGCSKTTKQWQRLSQEFSIDAPTQPDQDVSQLNVLDPSHVQPSTSQQDTAAIASVASKTRRQTTSTRYRRALRRYLATPRANNSVRKRFLVIEECRMLREEQRNAELTGIRMAIVELCSKIQQLTEELHLRNSL